MLVRVSPDEWLIIFQNGNDGMCQIFLKIMFVHLLEEMYPGLTFDIYPAACKSKGGSRHDMSTCPGLNQLYNVLLRLRMNQRFSNTPEDFTAIGSACATIHPGSEIITVDEAFLPLFGSNGMHELRFNRDEALRALSATIGSSRDITKSLEDTRTEEEIEIQNDILSLAIELTRNPPAQLKLDIAQAALIGQCELLSEYASALIGIMRECSRDLTELGGDKDYQTVATSIINEMKKRYPSSPLTKDLSNVTSAFLSRRSTGTSTIGFGEDMGMGAATGFPVRQTLTNAAAMQEMCRSTTNLWIGTNGDGPSRYCCDCQ